MESNLLIAPSILSADFGHLTDEVKRIEDAGADMVHIDIMDGHFVPNLTMGPKTVATIKRSTNLFLDVHLMMYNPFDYVERFVEAGADRLTFHFEAVENIEEVINYIHRCNCEVGLAFCPETSYELIPKFLGKCDLILLMTVNPGFGGQKFKSEVLEKISFVKTLKDKTKVKKVLSKQKENALIDIQVDGGINLSTGYDCAKAGANILVAGTYIFQSSNIKDAIYKLKHCYQ